MLALLVRILTYERRRSDNFPSEKIHQSKKVSIKIFKSEVKYNNTKYGFKDHQIFDFHSPIDELSYSSEIDKPLLILLHSGGFITGDKNNDAVVYLAEEISKYNINVASINYDKFQFKSLKLQHPIQTIKEKIFSTFKDLSLAVRYFKENAESYRIHKEKIFVAGISSGGIVALTTTFFDVNDITRYFDLDHQCLHCGGLTNSEFSVRGVISINGAMLNVNVIDQNDNIPTLLIYGSKDGIIPHNKGKPFEKYIDDIELDIPGIAHEFSISDFDIGYKLKLKLQEKYVKIIRDQIFPEIYGSNAIKQRMKYHNLPIQIKKIKNGKHNLFFNEDGTQTGNLNVIVKEISTFINYNSRQ